MLTATAASLDSTFVSTLIFGLKGFCLNAITCLRGLRVLDIGTLPFSAIQFRTYVTLALHMPTFCRDGQVRADDA